MEVFSKIQTEVSSYNNFFLTGRFGNFRYVNMNDCIEMSFDLIGDLTGAPLEETLAKVNL